jgi:hypothetical protein
MCPAHAFAREGEREGARRGTRARARTEIAPSHGAQVEAQAVEREVGRVRVHHLELRRERNGGGGRQPWNLHENDRRGCREGRGTPIASTETRKSALFSVKPKVSFRVSFHAVRSLSGNPKGRERETPWGKDSRTEPALARASNALGAFGCSSKRTRHVRAAVPRCAARARRETRGTSGDARSTDARARNRANRAPARVPRARSSRRARARREDRRGKSRIPLKQRSFPAPKRRMRAGLWRTVESNARVGSGVISGVMLAEPARRASAARGV